MGWREGRNTGSLLQRSEAPVHKQSKFPRLRSGWGTNDTSPTTALPGISFSGIVPAFSSSSFPFLSFHICSFIGYRFVTDQQIYCRFKRLQGPSLSPPVLCSSIIRFYKSHKEDLNGSRLRPLSLSTLMPPLPKLPSHMVTIKETCHLGNPAKRKSSWSMRVVGYVYVLCGHFQCIIHFLLPLLSVGMASKNTATAHCADLPSIATQRCRPSTTKTAIGSKPLNECCQYRECAGLAQRVCRMPWILKEPKTRNLKKVFKTTVRKICKTTRKR